MSLCVCFAGASDKPQAAFFETNIKGNSGLVESTEEEEAAAVRIQAAFKGYTTRRNLKEQPNKDSIRLPNWHSRLSVPPSSPPPQEEACLEEEARS